MLDELESILPEWVRIAEDFRSSSPPGDNIFLFAMTGQWITQTTLTALGFRGLGHELTLGFLPYLHWKKPGNAFDKQRQNVYIKHILKPLANAVHIVPILELNPVESIPEAFDPILRKASLRDVKYSLMREDIGTDHPMFDLRMKRNTALVRHLLPWLKENPPDVVIVPNGSVLEFGVVFRLARYLEIPVVTYEFGEQDQRMWLAQNRDVMRQQTDRMWQAYQGQPLTAGQRTKIEKLISARRGADRWNQFSRQWQKTTSKGGQKVRRDLDLDDRPIALLPTNVLGDSLTLGREVFSESMTEWIVKTIRYFFDRPQYQLVVRIHPGEQLSWGPSLLDILDDYFDSYPDHIHIIGPEAEINSYDLVDIASLTTVFTTTLGLEAAMSGLPVIVVGETHYRGKGFTLDPQSWEEYFSCLGSTLQNPGSHAPEEEKIEKAWTYAYRFFFDYPFPYPWHVQHYPENIKEWPLDRALGGEGQEKFGATFQYLRGEPIQWRQA